MVYDRSFITEIFDLVDENVQAIRDAVDSAIPGTPLGVVPASDEESARLFEQKALENPNWVLALPYVEGGMALLARYEKTRGLRSA